jgi:hypothetical protein
MSAYATAERLARMIMCLHTKGPKMEPSGWHITVVIPQADFVEISQEMEKICQYSNLPEHQKLRYVSIKIHGITFFPADEKSHKD